MGGSDIHNDVLRAALMARQNNDRSGLSSSGLDQSGGSMGRIAQAAEKQQQKARKQRTSRGGKKAVVSTTFHALGCQGRLVVRGRTLQC